MFGAGDAFSQHVEDLLYSRHRLIPPLEFGTVKAIAVLERGNLLVGESVRANRYADRGHRLTSRNHRAHAAPASSRTSSIVTSLRSSTALRTSSPVRVAARASARVI